MIGIRPRALLLTLGAVLALSLDAPSQDPPGFSVLWHSPSEGPRGSMPLGNGDIALNAWVDARGDLLFYVAKTDSWGDNGRLLKVGRLRFHIEPAPLGAGDPFSQRLDLARGIIEVRCGAGEQSVQMHLWVDANHPVVQVEIEAGAPVVVTAHLELWRSERQELSALEVSDVLVDRSRPDGQHAPCIVEPDQLLDDLGERIGWVHRNRKSVGPALTARIQGLDGFERPDPLLHRTFGAILCAPGGRRVDATTLRSPARRSQRFSLHVLTLHPASVARWRAAIEGQIQALEGIALERRRREHEAWWRRFWQRSWLRVQPDPSVAPAPLLPAGEHPLLAGVDQAGGNRLRGEIARVDLFERALTGGEIAAVAAAGKAAPPPRAGLLGSWEHPAAGALDPAPTRLEGLRTLSAWVRPGELPAGGGRILDRVTPGGSDGFLLDTYPGNSLRFIAGERILMGSRGCLESGRWHHVAAVVDERRGALELYLDGERVAAQEVASDAETVSRAYALQRFVTACAGRGRYPIKFNGSLFTVPWPGKPGDADYRRWGPGYWWQNSRLPYISLCTSGDFDLQLPFFRMYLEEILPVARHRTRAYFGHGGAFLSECVYFWGDVFSETYGWKPCAEREDKLQESRWHKWEWVAGPELVHMLLDYYEHTLDEEFLAAKVLPVAREVLAFFAQHYHRDERGKLVMHPAQALETWWECTDPMPEIAGLHAVTARLLALPAGSLPSADRRAWSALRDALPALPTREVKGRRLLAPAARFARKSNVENPELYAVFPFRLIAIGRPDLELGIEALHQRLDRGHSGWRQDDIFMAYLGLAEEARRNVSARARAGNRDSRFAAFWGPNYDWVPDQDHGGVLMKALQAMVLQSDGRAIHLLPAWPRGWDLDFRLHAPYRTVVTGRVRGGKLVALEVVPAERRADVIVHGRR